MTRSITAGVLVTIVTLAGVPAYASAIDDVKGAVLRLAALSSYQMSFGAGARSATMDIVKPNSMHMQSKAVEMISVGGSAYVKSGGRGWIKIPSSTSQGMATSPYTDWARVAMSDTKGVSATDLGMKSIDGETVHAYLMTKDGKQSTMYVGGDGLPHRIDSGTSPGQSVRFGKFNAVAPIRAPI
jgi:hypothetical protein